MADIGAVQSRLFTITAALSPSKDRYGSIWPRITSTHDATVSLALRVRSELGLGSPIRPVDPPTSASGRCPACCSRRAVSTCTRWPWCRLGAVGSKPT